MYSKVNYTLIGFFVLLFVGGIIGFAFWLGDRGDQNDYRVYILRTKESVTGLSPDSGVKMKGVDVGHIKTIEINPKNIEEVNIVLNIYKRIPIKEDMYGLVKMYGLTGLSYIEISGGSNIAADLTTDDGTPPVIPAGVSFYGRVEENIGNISMKLERALDKIDKVLTQENIQKFDAIMSNTEKVTGDTIALGKNAVDTLERARVALDDFNRTFNSIGNDFHDVSKSLDGNVEPTLEKFAKMSQDISQLAKNIERTINRGDYNLKKILNPMIIDIRELSRELEMMSTHLDRSPSDIFFKSKKSAKGPGE